MEKNEAKRYKVKGGTFVVLRPQTSSARLGSILDISRDGLSFQYPVNCNLCLKSFTELDIFISGDGAYLHNIPIKIISDIKISADDPFHSTTMKRFGVKFAKLTKEQSLKIDAFIQNHTNGQALDRRVPLASESPKRRWYDTFQQVSINNIDASFNTGNRRSGCERRNSEFISLRNLS